jgi:hypothetical protein
VQERRLQLEHHLSGSDGWFCAMSERRQGYGHGAWMLLIALGLLARRRTQAAR